MVSLLSRILAALVVLLFLGAGPAQAHDELIGTQPTDGASLKEAPEDLTLTFSGALSDIGTQVTVTNGDGDSVTDGDPRVQGVDVIQDLTELPKGDYEVLWRVTSADGHPISGSFAFAVTTEPTPSATTAPAAEDGAASVTTEADGTSAAQTEPLPSGTASAPEPAADGAAPATDNAAADSGTPVWVWVVGGAVVVVLLGGLSIALARRRS